MFNQPNWSVNEVYNVAGDLILSKSSGKQDFVAALQELKAEVARLTDLDRSERDVLEGELEGAIGEASSPDPDRDGIVRRLTSVRERLTAVGGAVSSALEVAKIVGAVAIWAGGFF
jgi:hypothetical protein